MTAVLTPPAMDAVAGAEAGPAPDPGPTRLPDPTWVRPALAALLMVTAGLYLWNLDASGWANAYYSAAAQAGSESWKAFLFGSFDAANAITVDKPPLSLWPQALAVRVFGLSTWSILVPQALMGVASVAVLYAAVRRSFGGVAGLLAGLVLALTPVAALMFRYNNPDALLTLCMTLAAAAALRALEDGRTRWFVATGVAVGLGFLTKQLQVLLVVPGFALAHLALGPGGPARRVRDLAVAGAAVAVSAGWWLALVEWWPAGSRPYIGGSPTNSILELTLGYNGLGRLTGNEVGSVGGGGPASAPGGLAGGAGAAGGPPGRGTGGPGAGMWGETGLGRLFDLDNGGQIAWLLPAAVVLGLLGLWLTRRAPRADPRRQALVVWGGWLVVTAATFSFMSGIYHAYYTVALAPAVAALCGGGAVLAWQHRHQVGVPLVLAAVVAGSGWWAGQLLGRAPQWYPWLADLVPVLALGAAVALVATRVAPADAGHGGGWPATRTALGAGAAGVALVALLAGPAAWSVETVTTGASGSLVSAGPTVVGAVRGPGGGNGAPTAAPGGITGGPAVARPQPGFPGQGVPGQGVPRPGFPGQGVPGQGVPGQGVPGQGVPGQGVPQPGFPGQGVPGQGAPGTGGGPGGLLAGPAVAEDLVELLLAGAEGYTWVAATTGAQNAASYQLATEEPVMAIGGFNGSDPSPTLAQFQDRVAAGQVHYYLANTLSGLPSMGGSDAARQIADWVAEHYESTTVGGVSVFDLSG